MLGLPKTTEFNKRILKQKFYENLSITPALKKSFVEDIRIIYWKNKISPETMNLAPGKQVSEIEVFELRLNAPALDEAVLRQIDREIPYHILFLLEYERKYQAWIGYKEAATGNNAFKVNRYYHSEWLPEEELPLKPDGLDMDSVYENLVRQLAGGALQTAGDSQESLQESVQRSEKKEKLQKQIVALQVKMRKEKQLNKQMEMNAQLKRLKRELEAL